MEEVRWLEIGFTREEALVLAGFQRTPESWTLGVELAVWRQWVTEIERGELHTRDELESAYDVRDDIEDSCSAIASEYRERLYDYLDELDLTFRDSTVHLADSKRTEPNGRWWRGRIPVRNRARAYLFDED
ncbi:hypothetical protein [Kribbella voronezhensis]|uniref:hypothetical protein n=1 Tax=Kribbella voronezhensis TaxID=2512212 RepID=UPI0010637976|nr:hypothetical protein [Kribbella voronezhensis]